MTAFKFHDLPVSNITPEAAGAVAITLQVPKDLRSGFNFKAGQFLTLRATIDGDDVTGSVKAGAFGTFPLTGKRAA